MNDLNTIKLEFRNEEKQLLNSLRKLRQKHREVVGNNASKDHELTVGQRIADTVASTMGSWKFIIIQTTILFFWIVLNVTAYIQQWDPYPFILLNLALSFQAAYAAPFIMMSQNRQQDIDRQTAKNDYQVNVKAELEIELLHQKIDQLREMEILNLTKVVNELVDVIRKEKVKKKKEK